MPGFMLTHMLSNPTTTDKVTVYRRKEVVNGFGEAAMQLSLIHI